jgi:hypothetical protein
MEVHEMATIPIEPINVKSGGGFDVRITGICPTDHNCLHGELSPPGIPLTRERWNMNGIMSGGTGKCNLDMRSNEMIDLVETAKRLGAV